MYTAFAAVYDRLMRDVDYDGWADHYAKLLAGAHIRGCNICECACGTGSLTIPLCKRGFRMTGVDLSRDMLSVAAQRARDAGLDIPFVCQDMCRLQLHKRQDAILSTCDGVNYLTTPQRAKSFFRSAYAQLKPGGALIFDVSTPEKLSVTLGSNTLGCQDDDISYVWQNAYHPRTRTVDMRLSFFVREADGRYRRFEETQTQRAHTLEELTQYLTEAGFCDIRAYGKQSLRVPRPGDERWHIRAIRPKENAT
jgi:ubiquinone/menaquinone biosynthesis C-methylase UbiE